MVVSGACTSSDAPISQPGIPDWKPFSRSRASRASSEEVYGDDRRLSKCATEARPRKRGDKVCGERSVEKCMELIVCEFDKSSVCKMCRARSVENGQKRLCE